MKVVPVLGWDNGFDFEKFEAGENKVKFVSRTYQPRKDKVFDLGKSIFNPDNMVVELDGNIYYVGAKADKQAADSSDRKFRDEKFKEDTELVKLLAGIELLFGDEIDGKIRIEQLGLGLNVGAFKKYKDEIVELYNNRTIKYQAGGKERELYIDSVSCYPQGIASFYDELLDMEGNMKNDNLATARYGLIDIGGRTVDAFVADGIDVITDSVINLKEGTTNAFKIASSALDDIPFGIIQEDYLKGNDKTFYNKEYDIKKPCEDAFRELAEKIYDEVQLAWDDYMPRVQFIILCGGGAQSLRKDLNDLFDKDITVISDAQFSNARGYYKLTKM
ncbi:hypothetical protein U472_00270 [Orenia metallireducens]|jgi:hypothetical protein|uniref:Uncharacterized protein n=1 Tax=Orenia metallireducens TaxID=1413210 RepID=A0A1C0ADD6_9FIRM|nr:ParM/StbA family protein [Orenia metallireducens]OCL28626.1 hypothetical protein U472_00270 [Orenia metallireducens]